jgi:hypothetical protein
MLVLAVVMLVLAVVMLVLAVVMLVLAVVMLVLAVVMLVLAVVMLVLAVVMVVFAVVMLVLAVVLLVLAVVILVLAVVLAVLAVGLRRGCGDGELFCDTMKKSLTQHRDQELGKELIYKDIHWKKRLAIFPSPAELSQTKLSLTRPERVLVSEIPAGIILGQGEFG